MKLVSLETTVNDVGSPRDHFLKLKEHRDSIIAKLDPYTDKLDTAALSVEIVKYLAKGFEVFASIVDEELAYPMVVRTDLNKKSVVFFHTYDWIHAQSSIIRNVLLHRTMSVRTKINYTLYLLYYYWFLRVPNYSDTELQEKVCLELENIIKTLILKEATVYRNFNVTRIVAALKFRLSSERLSLESKSSINFRKKKR